MIEDCDFLRPELIDDPHPYLHRLRREDPVHWSAVHRAWVLTRYDDVAAAFLDERLSSERTASLLPAEPTAEERELFDPIYRLLGNWMVFRDPPAHARLRRLARAAFGPRTVAGLRPSIESLVEERIAALERAGGGDFVSAFAYPLPSTVIATLLGVPQRDLDAFRGWSEDVVPLVFGAAGRAERRDRALRGLAALEALFRDLLERYRRDPADNLLTALARAEDQGEVLSADEVTATCVLLLFAGHETTAALLATGVLHLDRHAAERAKLAANPALAASAVEELLRFDGPTKTQVRLAREDLELRGRRIRAGQRLMLCQAAANRDPERFADPDRLDLARRENDHLGFGLGIHHCLGAPLARLEAEVAFAALPRRLPSLRVAAEHPEWQPNALNRSLKSLPVVLG
ncbi:MAG: cytochrome P450 [Deltaproteobacteria bacterium]|nr:cytochrome P450 [Deltaproteobacteria bacterium]